MGRINVICEQGAVRTASTCTRRRTHHDRKDVPLPFNITFRNSQVDKELSLIGRKLDRCEMNVN